MRKTITIIAITSFAFAANAQKNKITDSETQKTQLTIEKQITDLTSIVSIDPQLKGDLTYLLFARAESMENAATSEEKKAIFMKYGKKFIGGLDSEQVKILESKNPELLKSITDFKE